MSDKCPRCGDVLSRRIGVLLRFECGSGVDDRYIVQSDKCHIRELEATVAERDKTITNLEREADHLRSLVVAGTWDIESRDAEIAALQEERNGLSRLIEHATYFPLDECGDYSITWMGNGIWELETPDDREPCELAFRSPIEALHHYWKLNEPEDST